MPNANPKDILTAIKTTLTASPSLVNSTTLKQVEIGMDIDTDAGFPFVRIYMLDVDSPVADTVSYERAWAFGVDVLQEFTQKSKENAELDLANALHAVLNRLQATGGTPPTWQLGVGIEKAEIQTTPVRTVQVNGTPMRMASIRLVCTTLVQNPS